MAKLKCPECGNDKTWRNVQMSNKKSKATCSKCGHVVESTGGIEVDTIEGGMDFSF